MNGTLRRLVTVGFSAMAVLWATRPGIAWASPCVRLPNDHGSTTCSADSAGELWIACGSARFFNASAGIHRIEVANADVAEVASQTNRDLTIKALKVGSTKVSIWSEASDKPVTLVVHVVKPDAMHHEGGGATAGVPSFVPTAAAATPGLPSGAETNYVQHMPAISLETSAPIQATVGKAVEQQILVKNVGSVAAEHVEVRGNVSIDSEMISADPKPEISNSTLV